MTYTHIFETFVLMIHCTFNWKLFWRFHNEKLENLSLYSSLYICPSVCLSVRPHIRIWECRWDVTVFFFRGTRNWGLFDRASSSWNKVTVRMVPCDAHGGTIRTVHTIYAAALKTTTHPQTRCRKPYAATQHLMLLMMGVCTRNMSR